MKNYCLFLAFLICSVLSSLFGATPFQDDLFYKWVLSKNLGDQTFLYNRQELLKNYRSLPKENITLDMDQETSLSLKEDSSFLKNVIEFSFSYLSPKDKTVIFRSINQHKTLQEKLVAYRSLMTSDEGRMFDVFDISKLYVDFFNPEERNISLMSAVEYKERLFYFLDKQEFSPSSYSINLRESYICLLFERLIKNVDFYPKKGHHYLKKSSTYLYTDDLLDDLVPLLIERKKEDNQAPFDITACPFYKNEKLTIIRSLYNKVIRYIDLKDSKKSVLSAVARDFIFERNKKMYDFFADENTLGQKEYIESIINMSETERSSKKNYREISVRDQLASIFSKEESDRTLGEQLYVTQHLLDCLLYGHIPPQGQEFFYLVEIKTKQMALHKVAISGKVSLYKYLYDLLGRDQLALQMKVLDTLEQTPFHLAIRSGSIALAEDFLSDFEIDFFQKDSDGNTPLHLAVFQKNALLVKEILERSGTRLKDLLSEKNGNGKTVMAIAFSMGDYKLLRLLKEFSAH